ncbi:MAG TPA: LysM peptidoglycan-binding domain-containing protein [Myxococcota bacterium]|jgi:nucleoid-associated protein YgaU|nr:LysM peptidoglycan-binding domain-containing protein [Myxococcota bacterium]
MASSLVKAILRDEDKGKDYKVQFNPKEYAIEKSVPWNPQATAGNDAPEMQFTTGQAKQLSFELFFDRWEEQGDVRLAGSDGSAGTKEIESLALINAEKHRPPIVIFSWGGETFKGVIESLSQKFTMFLPSGVPCRATISVRIKEALLAKEGTEKHSPDKAKMRVVRRGETLNSIAAEEYDDAGEWRRIADFNGIDDPRELVPGTKLMVPPIIR